MKKGFTIIESIVALTIIIAAVVGPFMLVTRGILSSKSAKNRLIASNLAQEGIEFIRYYRDSNILASCVGPDGADFDEDPDPDWRALTDTRQNCTPLIYNGANDHWETDASYDLSDSRDSRLGTPTPRIDGSGDSVLKFCRAAAGTNFGLYAYDCPNDPDNLGTALNTTFKRIIKISVLSDEPVCVGLPCGPLVCPSSDPTVVCIPGSDRMKIDAIILWQDGAVARTLTQTEVLYNWR